MASTSRQLERERSGLLYQLERALEGPMVLLAFAWLALLIIELTRGLPPGLTVASRVIWVVFVAEFATKLAVAPRKLAYLRRNALAALALLVPALRIARLARVVRILRLTRGLRLVRIVGSLNRGLRTVRRLMRRRRLGLVLATTAVIAFTGAAGMMAFERDGASGAFGSYASSLWWTAMVLTTMGSETWPRTAEGRLLCLALAVYSFTTFGYITASLASYFVAQDEPRRRGHSGRTPEASVAGRADGSK